MPRSKASIRDEELRANAEPYDWSRGRLSDEEVKEFALGIYRGDIFTELHLHEHDRTNPSIVNMVFMGLAMSIPEMGPEERGAFEKSPPGMIYARYRVNGRDNTFPRSVNGYPIFNACSFLSREDTDRVNDKYNEIVKALESA